MNFGIRSAEFDQPETLRLDGGLPVLNAFIIVAGDIARDFIDGFDTESAF